MKTHILYFHLLLFSIIFCKNKMNNHLFDHAIILTLYVLSAELITNIYPKNNTSRVNIQKNKC